MANLSVALRLLFLLFSQFMSLSHARSCSSQSFPNNHMFSSCMDHPVLQSSVHWNHDPSSDTVQLAYRRNDVPASTWIAWAINPTSRGMVGSQAIVAFKGADGLMNVYTTQITSYQPLMHPGSLSFLVSDLSVVQQSGDVIIFATIQLPSNTTTMNQVWQQGTVARNNPSAHSPSGDNLKSFGSIDFRSGKANPTPSSTETATGYSYRPRLKDAHWVLNVIGWGFLLPVGVMLGRHLKAISKGPAWFYFHMICQAVGCCIGWAGWITGMILGRRSRGIQYTIHRHAGISIFIASVIQLAAAYGRHKSAPTTMPLWNKFHHCCGYAIIVVAVINIYQGFDILQSRMKWKAIYTIVLAALSVITIALELNTELSKPPPAKPAAEAPPNDAEAPAAEAAAPAAPSTGEAAPAAAPTQAAAPAEAAAPADPPAEAAAPADPPAEAAAPAAPPAQAAASAAPPAQAAAPAAPAAEAAASAAPPAQAAAPAAAAAEAAAPAAAAAEAAASVASLLASTSGAASTQLQKVSYNIKYLQQFIPKN